MLDKCHPHRPPQRPGRTQVNRDLSCTKRDVLCAKRDLLYYIHSTYLSACKSADIYISFLCCLYKRVSRHPRRIQRGHNVAHDSNPRFSMPTSTLKQNALKFHAKTRDLTYLFLADNSRQKLVTSPTHERRYRRRISSLKFEYLHQESKKTKMRRRRRCWSRLSQRFSQGTTVRRCNCQEFS